MPGTGEVQLVHSASHGSPEECRPRFEINQARNNQSWYVQRVVRGKEDFEPHILRCQRLFAYHLSCFTRAHIRQTWTIHCNINVE